MVWKQAIPETEEKIDKEACESFREE